MTKAQARADGAHATLKTWCVNAVRVALILLVIASPTTYAAPDASVVQTIDLRSVRGSWLETTRSDGFARAVHFEEQCIDLEMLQDADTLKSSFWRSCTRQCMPQGFCAYPFASEEGVAIQTLVLGGWIINDGGMRLFGTLYLHGAQGQIVDGVPVSFAPPQ